MYQGKLYESRSKSSKLNQDFTFILFLSTAQELRRISELAFLVLKNVVVCYHIKNVQLRIFLTQGQFLSGV